MPKRAPKSRRSAKFSRKGRRPQRSDGVASTSRPSSPNWDELLSAIRELGAEVRRLADIAEAPVDGRRRRLDWEHFAESRAAAAADRERYWKETGVPKAAP